MSSRRLLRPDDATLTEEQLAAIRLISSGPRGTISAPFEAMLASPELMTRVQKVGEFLRFDSSLPPAILETIILATARHWNQPFEWGYHYPLAVSAGISEETLHAIGEGDPPAESEPLLRSIWTATNHLLRNQAIDDELYEQLTLDLGAHGVVDLIVTVGYYSLLALVLNTARAPAPENGAPALPLKKEQ